ncbi:hypothetical protein SDC9_139225 [bioreactor metagenome]|uniref:Uncharacterized protein n=1 Tax=bioreactor metagenome TaxID=1076179 RepID=A0A645DS07_9ZZZZ
MADVFVRDAVEHLFDRDMVRLVRYGLLPRRELVGDFRQGQKSGLLLGEKGVEPAAFLFLEGFGVEPLELLGYPLVQFTDTEEHPVPERRQDPRGDDSDRSFGIRFVPGFPDPRRDDRRAVVFRQFTVDPVDDGVVPVRPGDSGFEVVGNQDAGHAAEVPEHVHVRGQPALLVLVGEGLHIRVPAAGEYTDEYISALPFGLPYPGQARGPFAPPSPLRRFLQVCGPVSWWLPRSVRISGSTGRTGST